MQAKIGVTYIGYKPMTLTLGKDDNYKLQLTPNEGLLDEVVVTGYQTLPKERATGAFAKISSDELQGQNVTSISDMLTGHVAGMQDGKLRGVTSMNGLTTPLYVIDGFPVEKTTNDGLGNWEEGVPEINVEDIESITVLKDAAATSIYGARAANGVVVITTKRTKKGKVDVNFSMGLTYNPYRTYTGRWADAETMVGLERDLIAQHPSLQGDGAAAGAQNLLDNATYVSPAAQAMLRGMTGALTQDQVNALLNGYAAAGYQYYKDADKYGKRDPFYQQYNLRLASSTDNNNFTASVSYRNNQFADKYNRDNNLGVSLQNTLNLTNWLTFDAGAFINYGTGQEQSYSLTSPGFANFPYLSLGTPENPYISTAADRYSVSNQNTLTQWGLNNMDINPYDELGMGLTHNRDLDTRVYGRLIFKLTDWLRFTTQYQYEAAQYRSEQLREKESFYTRNRVNTFARANAAGTGVDFVLPNGNIFSNAYNDTRAYDYRAQFDFNKSFNDVHNVTALAGFEMRENKNTYNRYTYYNYDPDMMTYSMIDQTKLSAGAGGLWGGWASFGTNDVFYQRDLLNRFISYYGNAAYDYNGKYMLTGSIRWDRTNLYATGSKYQNKPIWSVGAGWRIDQEDFMHVDWVNMLKLRTSYGIGGNIAKMSAPYLTTYYGNNAHVNLPSAGISTRPNPNLRWEKTYTFNVGLDFGLLNNRLNGAIEFYNKKGVDLLANTQGVPVEGFGYTTYTINNGEMTNRGVELTLSAVAVSTPDLNWTINGTAGYNHNNVDYVNIVPPAAFLQIDQAQAFPRIGDTYNAIYGYKWAGLNANGNPQVYNAAGEATTSTSMATLDDIVCLGAQVPSFTGSLGSTLRYKNWSLSMLFLAETGHKMRNTNMAWWDGKSSVVSVEMANRWQQPGDEAYTDVPAFVSPDSPMYNWEASSVYSNASINVVDADNFRMRNLSLAYTVPANVARTVQLQGARVMVGMENLFMVCANKDAKYMLGGYNRPNYVLSLNIDF